MKIEKVVFVESDRVIPYDCKKHRIGKFIVRKDGLIMVGPSPYDGSEPPDHRLIAMTYTRLTGERIAAGEIVAAGRCDGRYVEYWGSDGFRITTPEELRPAIRKALGFPE